MEIRALTTGLEWAEPGLEITLRDLATLKGMDAKEVKEKLPQWMEKLEVKGKLTNKIKSL